MPDSDNDYRDETGRPPADRAARDGGKTYWFEDEGAFLEKIRELRARGLPPDQLEVYMPIPVHGFEEALGCKPSRLRLFTLAGGLGGGAFGFWFTIWTVHDWPLVVAGKPLVSIPPFVVIAFACTILLGALVSFAGFLLLSRMPSPRGLTNPEEHENYFVVREVEPEPRG